MTWITENPWPGIVLLAGIAATAWIVGFRQRSRIVAGCILLGALLWFVESRIVTPSEQLDVQLETLRRGFIEGSEEQVFSQISAGAEDLRETARQGLSLVRLSPLFSIRDVEVELSADGTTARVSLRANGLLTIRQSDATNHVATRWRTTWRQESGEWKLSDVVRLNPITGEEIGVLSP
ncbi:MAG: hypothetical protein RLZZ458_831 [Planctomycetota bacterium]|jgi:hypothetical protein